MSTTVSYKGQTLTTVSNDTKTLLTEGKYLEDDLTLVDVSGGGATLITKSISANGTYNASSDSADGYSQVTVAVPASAVDTGTKNITANGSNQDVVGYAAVDVAVPNSYSASDEGKVVSSGALAAQTAHADVTPTTSDQTIDTTTNNSIKVKGDADLIATNIKKDVEIFGVTGSYEGGGGALYPLVNGSHTFSNGTTATVTNGSHVVIEIANGNTADGFVNFSDVSENSNNFNTTSNVQNKSAKFSVDNGETAIFVIAELTAINNISFNVYGTSTSNLGMAITNVSAGTHIVTKKFNANTDVGCLFFVGKTPGTYTFDVAFYVDDKQYV